MSLASCAQMNHGIIKAYGYSRPETRGTIPEQDRVKGPDTLYIVLLETKPEATASWTWGQVGTKSFNVLSRVVSSPFMVGVLTNADDTAYVEAADGNKLWQLTLEKTRRPSVPAQESSAPNEILLSGMENGKPINYRIKTIKSLKPILYQ